MTRLAPIFAGTAAATIILGAALTVMSVPTDILAILGVALLILFAGALAR